MIIANAHVRLDSNRIENQELTDLGNHHHI